MRILFFLVILLTQASASDDWGEEDAKVAKDFFSAINIAPTPIEKKIISPWSNTGFIEEQLVYSLRNTQNKVKHLRTNLENTLSLKFANDLKALMQIIAQVDGVYQWGNTDNFSDAEIDEYKNRIEFGEVYIDGLLSPPLNLKIGRQIAPLGLSDFFQITDRVNPRNEMELGLIDLDESRLPVFATRLSHIKEDLQFDLIWVAEKRSSRIAPNNSDYDYFALLQQNGITVNRGKLSNSSPDELFIHIKKIWEHGDTSFIAGYSNEDLPYISSATANATDLILNTNYDSNKFLGVNASLIWQRFVFKFEANYIFNKLISRSDINAQLANNVMINNLILSEQHDTSAIMLGFDYTTKNAWNITAELLNEHTMTHNNNLSVKKNFRIFSLLANKTWMNDKLGLTLFANHIFNNDGDFIRFNIDYELSKNTLLEMGGINYEVANNDSVYSPYKDNDRVYFSIKYSY